MNSRGEVGTTMTWAVATVLIFMILLVFVSISGVFSFFGGIFGGIGSSVETGITGSSYSNSEIFDLLEFNYDKISEWVDQGRVPTDRIKGPLKNSILNYIGDNNLELKLTLIKKNGREIDNEIVTGESLEAPDKLGYLKGVNHLRILTKGGNFVDVYYK